MLHDLRHCTLVNAFQDIKILAVASTISLGCNTVHAGAEFRDDRNALGFAAFTDFRVLIDRFFARLKNRDEITRTCLFQGRRTHHKSSESW
jgi:hypothetical protein